MESGFGQYRINNNETITSKSFEYKIKIKLALLWSKNCISSEKSITPKILDNTDAIPPVQEVTET